MWKYGLSKVWVLFCLIVCVCALRVFLNSHLYVRHFFVSRPSSSGVASRAASVDDFAKSLKSFLAPSLL